LIKFKFLLFIEQKNLLLLQLMLFSLLPQKIKRKVPKSQLNHLTSPISAHHQVE
jgi:hypothetical protein